MAKLETVAARVSALIEGVHGGSVNLAAKELGLKQQTLALIASGGAKRPRTDSLQRIAAAYGASMDWLITGEGDAPPVLNEHPEHELLPQAEFRRWWLLVRSLGLSPELTNDLLKLPKSVINASFYTNLGATLSGKRKQQEWEALRESMRLEYRAWILRLQTWLAINDTPAVVSALEENLDMLKVGFSEQMNVNKLEERMLRHRSTLPEGEMSIEVIPKRRSSVKKAG